MADIPAAAQVTQDVPCRRCGYNLRTLTTDAKCPECGTAVADSLRGNLLRDADPEWIKTLSRGARLKLDSITLWVCSILGVGLLIGAGLPPVIAGLVGFAGSVLGLWGTLAITTQEPRVSLREDPLTLRKALRVCAIVAAAGTVLLTTIVAGGSGIVALIGMCMSFVGIFVVWGELLYFRRFAERLADTKLRRSTSMLMWIGPITLGLVLLSGLVEVIFFSGTATPGPTAGPAAALAPPTPANSLGAAIGDWFFPAFALYLLLWYVRLLTRYRKAFGEALTYARAATATQAL